jgi:hypothetical protein
VSFAALTLYVASQRVFIVLSVYFVIDSVRILLDTPSYICLSLLSFICILIIRILFYKETVQCWALVNSVMNFEVSFKCWQFLGTSKRLCGSQ